MKAFRPRFAHLGLRWNPFGEVPAGERGALAVMDLEPWVALLRRPRHAVQFIGDSGRGKSTRLLALADALPGACYLRVLEQQRERLGWPDDASALLIDEAQHAPRRMRTSWFADGLPLALGTHEDLTAELVAAGYDVTTLPVAGVSPRELATLCERRVAWAARRGSAVPRVTEDACHELIARHGTDVRAIEGDLYDVFQDLTALRAVDAPTVQAVRRSSAATTFSAARPPP